MSTNRPFDLAKIDTEATRKRTRKKLLIVSLPITVFVFLAGLWLMAPRLATNMAISSYDSGNYDSAQTYLRPLSFANAFERYKLYFNRGTAAAMNKQYDYAADQFVVALAYVNDEELECKVRYNLVLTYVKQAESFVMGAKYAEAVTAYTKAIAQVDAKSSCFDPKLREQLVKNRDEVRKLMEEQNSNKDGDQESEDGNSSGEPSESQQKKLEQIERDAAVRRQEDKQLSKPSEPLRDMDDYVDKPW